MILSNDGLVAFHYRSYGTFFYKKIGFIVFIIDLPTTNSIEHFLCGKPRKIIAFFIKKCYNEGYEISRLYLGFRWNFTG